MRRRTEKDRTRDKKSSLKDKEMFRIKEREEQR